jgi:hypothetical protein
MRNDLDRFDIGGDIFAHAPIASGCGPHKSAFLIDQVDRQAVHL